MRYQKASPRGISRGIARARKPFPIVRYITDERDRSTGTHHKPAVEPYLRWVVRQLEEVDHLVDVREDLGVRDGVGDPDAAQGRELEFGERRRLVLDGLGFCVTAEKRARLWTFVIVDGGHLGRESSSIHIGPVYIRRGMSALGRRISKG